MRFVIKGSALSGNQRTQNSLDAILGRVEDAVHKIEIHDADLLEDCEWYKSSRPDRRKLLQEIAVDGLHANIQTQGPHLRSFDVFDESSASAGRQLAHTPLQILVENDISDGALVQAALKVFAKGETLELCFGEPSKLAPAALLIESRGGVGELKKLVKIKIDESDLHGRPKRIVVVTDSDGEWVGDVKEHAVEIRTLCADNGIPCPPLNQRTAENYIPDEIWSLMAQPPDGIALGPVVSVLMQLSPDQRDHMRFEKPTVEPWDSTKSNVAALFSNISDVNRELLKGEILKGRGQKMKILALTTHAATLTTAMLQGRDRRNDLQTLVRNIEDEL